MPIGVVSDTSPLQYLHIVGLLLLLPQFFGTVQVPVAVRDELRAGIDAGLDLPVVSGIPWIGVAPPVARHAATDGLRPGEVAAISLAIDRAAELVVIDDKRARAVASDLGLYVTGSVGIILRAKHEGRISAVGPHITRLIGAGFRLSPQFAREILALAGEDT